MAASITRWRRACWARVSGRVSVCSIPTAYPHCHLGLRGRGRYAGPPCQDEAPGARPPSSTSTPTPSRWRPPTAGCPGERGRQTRQRLLDATVELLATTSWRSVKVTDIARQAQTSPATFYQYFANVEQAIQVLAEGMVDQAGAAGRPGRRRLVRRRRAGTPR